MLLAPREPGLGPSPPGLAGEGVRGALHRRRLPGEDVGNGTAVSVRDGRVCGGEQDLLFYSILLYLFFSAAMAGKECSLKFPGGGIPPSHHGDKDPDKQIWGTFGHPPMGHGRSRFRPCCPPQAGLLACVLGDGPLVPPPRAFSCFSWWEKGVIQACPHPAAAASVPFPPGGMGRAGVPSTAGG